MRHPRLYRISLVANLLDGPRIAADSFALFDAIFETSAERYLVDSSKQYFRFRSLYDYQPSRIIVIMLGRDYRGTVYSKMKRGQDVKSSTRNWVGRMKAMEALTEDVPHQQLIRVKYEDLCADPPASLNRLCNFLEIDFSEKMLSRPTEDVHHLGGSPSKFDSSRTEIRFDESYLAAFCEEDLVTMREIARDVAKLWKYD